MDDLTVLADCHDACGESPFWDEGSQTLYWVDITGNKLHQRRWDTGAVHTTDPGVPVSALAMTETGELVAAGSEGIWLLRQGSEPIPLAREFEGESLLINDCIADERGRLLAGSTFFDGTDSYRPGNLYCLDSDGSISILDTGFQLANGMGFSPDGQTLYLTDSAVRRIYAYDYKAEAMRAQYRRVFVQVPQEEGVPDGLTVDRDGYVWSAQWFGSCLCRYRPDGSLERRVPVPADQTSSMTFGGPEYSDLFITSAAVADALALAPPRYMPSCNIGGQLFQLKTPFAGRPEFRLRLSPSARFSK